MPYIDTAARLRAEMSPDTSGELNFAITSLLVDYLSRKGQSYSRMNDCLGALEGAKLELYRRVIAPFEDEKKLLNGDCY